MARPQIHLTGMPYGPGLARGVLQQGMTADVSGRIIMLTQDELAPLELRPAGFVVIDGAPLSHAMIPLLGSGVPTVVVTAAQVLSLCEGVEVLIDGSTGLISTNLPAMDQMPAAASAGTGAATADGVAVHFRVSVRDLNAVQRAREGGAEAIGLVRSEFLMPDNGQTPDAEFYRHRFEALCRAAAPLPVTIRLIDISADKRPAWLPRLDGPGATLGVQGARLFDTEPVRSVYLAQLAAIDALSGAYDLRVLIPYLAGYEELRDRVAELRRRLSRPLAVGAMAEVPAAALQTSDWLELVDFVAVGCNDLMQCFFGADRDRPELRRYLDPYAPPLFRFLRQVSAAARDHLQRIQLCGVLSQLPGILPVLLGLGFRVFSVEAALLPYLRQTVVATSVADARALAESICAARKSRQVRELLGLNTP